MGDDAFPFITDMVNPPYTKADTDGQHNIKATELIEYEQRFPSIIALVKASTVKQVRSLKRFAKVASGMNSPMAKKESRRLALG
ncbi:hypothetical protein N7494_003370 [Penicillium frequentans]|uniref:Uncharacterized protein n=1 Tax=Penicillium frequentans TaxID=3151616 RepID=A0AAD6CYM0_9EURO|nr:hypothetical protein N7494_003370 [Penicillium glabrum]